MKEPAPHSKKFSYHKNEINETQPVNILKKFIYTGYTADTVPIPDFQFFFNVYKCEEITCKDTK